MELERVTQEFDANTQPYVDAISDAITATKDLVDQVQAAIDRIAALESAIAGIQGKEINVTTNFAAVAAEAKAMQAVINSLHGKNVTVGINQVSTVATEAADSVKTLGNEFENLSVDEAHARAETINFVTSMQEAYGSTFVVSDILKRFDGTLSEAEVGLARFAVNNTDAFRQLNFLGNTANIAAADVAKFGINNSEALNSVEKLAAGAATQSFAMRQAGIADTEAAAAIIRFAINSQDALSNMQRLGPASILLNESLMRQANSFNALNDLMAQYGIRISEDIGLVTLLRAKLQDLGTGPAILQAGGAGFWGMMAGGINLFGGYLSNLLPKWMTFIGYWHLVVEAAAEFAAVALPALIAFGAFAAAAGPSIDQIKIHLDAVRTVSSATLNSIKPLTEAFDQVAQAVQPAVYAMYGAALMVINSRMSEFKSLAVGAADVMQRLTARAASAVLSSGFSQFLKNAVTDLQLFGTAIGNVFGIIGNLLNALPHIAEILLSIVVGLTGALEHLTSSGVIQGIIQMGLAFHGWLIWAGLASTAVLALRGPLTAIGTAALAVAERVVAMGVAFIAVAAEEGVLTAASLVLQRVWATMLANPWVMAAVAIGALVGLMIAMSQTKTSAQNLQTSLQDLINQQTSIAGVFSSLANAVTQSTAAVAQQQQVVNQTAKTAVNLHTGIMQANAAYDLQVNTLNELKGVQAGFNQELGTAYTRMQGMGAQFGGLASAMGLFNLAGIKATDIATANAQQWSQDIQMMAQMKAGYEGMGISAGLLGNDLNAVTLQTEMQNAKISELNAAMANYISTVSGGETAFVGFETQMQAVNQALTNSSASLAVVTGRARLTTSATAAAGAAASGTAASMNGLDAASLQLRSAFDQAINAASTMLQNFQTMITVSGNAAQGTAMMGTAAKDLVAQLLPLATSQTSLAQVFAIATQGGYTGAQSMKALAQWTGNMGAAKAAAQLNAILGPLTAQIANLGNDAKTLASDMQNLTNQAIIAQASALVGLNPKVAAYLSAVQKWGPNSAVAMAAQKTMNDAVNQMNSLVGTAVGKIPSLTGNTQALGSAMGAAHGPTATLINDISNIISKAPSSTTDIQSLAVAVANHGTKSAAAAGARAQLISDLEKSGISAKAATTLVDGLTSALGRIPKSELISIIMSGHGSYSIVGSASAAGALAGVGVGAAGGATGGLVNGPGTPTSDSIPARLSAGEYVVRAAAVSHYGRSMMDAINTKKYAAGGFVEQGDLSVLSGQFANQMYRDFQSQMLSAMISQMRSALFQAEQAAMAAMKAMLSAATHGKGSVNVGVFDQGGLLLPGVNMAINNTGRAERVMPPTGSGGPMHIHFSIDGNQIAEAILPDIRAGQYKYDWRNSGQATYLKPS